MNCRNVVVWCVKKTTLISYSGVCKHHCANAQGFPGSTPLNTTYYYQYHYCERFEPRSHFKSRLSLIVRVNVVLNRTVVVDSV